VMIWPVQTFTAWAREATLRATNPHIHILTVYAQWPR
jgi:hypothetical protein